MLLALDTSVIVAGALAGHAFHPRAIVWQAAIYRGEVQAMVCAHALAEVYSVLSKIPGGLSPVATRGLAFVRCNTFGGQRPSTSICPAHDLGILMKVYDGEDDIWGVVGA